MDLRSLGIVQQEHNFVGSYRHVVDAQGRIQFPRALRRGIHSEAKDTLIVTHDPDGCLAAYPLNEWDQIRELWQQATSDPGARRARNMIRKVLANAAEARIDAQGRISISSELLDKVGIDGEAVIVGAFDRIELWAPARFDEAMEESGDTSESSAANLKVFRPGRQAGVDE